MNKRFPLEKIYQFGDKVNKLVKKPRRVNNIPVISIGNLTTGGTGKTPACIYLVKLLQSMNLKPAILTRGYGGSIYKEGGILSDGKSIFLSERESGDEPYLLAINLPGVPVAVGKNRYENGKKLAYLFDIDVFILDDGFQHYAMERDLDIVLIDSTNPFGNEHILPHGVLREPLEALERSQAIIFTKTSLVENEKIAKLKERVMGICRHENIFMSNHEPSHLVKLPVLYDMEMTKNLQPEKISFLKKKTVWALSGIGNHRAFEKTLYSLGVNEVESISFRDHYRYTLKDVAGILKRVSKDDVLVTTEKDWIRLQYYREQFSELDKFYYLAIEFNLSKNENDFKSLVKSVF